MILHGTELGRGEGQGTPVCLLHGLFGAAANWGSVMRRLAARHRVLAFDLRNHGGSPHDPAMSYDAMASDVAASLASRDALPAAVIGHSMGGKAAMRLALLRPAAVSRLLVADIVPVPYPPAFRPYAAAMQAMTLSPGLTRAEADAALAPAVPEAGVRGFLLQNLRFGAQPAWRIGLDAIAAGLPGIEGWEPFPAGIRYNGPALFLSGGRSGYVRPEHRDAVRALFPAARFAVLRRAGHWLHADDPDGFTATAEAFLGG